HREHAVEARGENRGRVGSELDVTLVARDDDSVCASPLGDAREVRGVGHRRRRVPGLVDPEQQCAIGGGVADGVDVELSVEVAAATSSGTGSQGVPIEQSTTPPGSASAICLSESRRSYGYGGGTNGTTVSIRATLPLPSDLGGHETAEAREHRIGKAGPHTR